MIISQKKLPPKNRNLKPPPHNLKLPLTPIAIVSMLNQTMMKIQLYKIMINKFPNKILQTKTIIKMIIDFRFKVLGFIFFSFLF